VRWQMARVFRKAIGELRHGPRQLAAVATIIVCATLTAASQGSAQQAAANLTKGCVERYDAATDYFPDKVTVEDAVNFTVSYHRSYKVVHTKTSAPNSNERYVLVQCGTSTPALQGELAGAQVVTVPITSLYSASTTHLALLVDLQRLDVLTGVSTKKYLIGDEIVKRAGSAQVREFAAASTIDTELVVSQRPSLFMTGGSTSAELSVLRQAGIPVVPNHEWLEPTALARAEWLKYMSLFLNEERAGQNHYATVKARYRALSARALAVPDAQKPTVMTGRGSRGDFVIAGGRSYVAALIRDAGGRYVWTDNTSTGSTTIDLEAQIKRASNADIWINGGGWANLAAIVKEEPRYEAFKAYRTGQVWVYERVVTPDGANDYWSRGVSHPDLVLADLVKIFHPPLAQQHQFQWYLQVPR
jgi:iron complex transport system substrate-binding protein